MKIVRGYTTAGQLLVQGHPELVAKVGDIVNLYLDQVSDPELPESIRALVVYPIVPSANGSVTTYSFEYDETDLNGAIEHLRHEDILNVLVYSTVGRSAYESYLITTDDDPALTEEQWVSYVAFQSAVSGGFEGTLEEWLDSLQASVTNSSVNAAIEADPVATQTALGLGSAAYTASTAYAHALGADDNYVTNAEKAALHPSATVTGNGINITGQAISLTFGTTVGTVAAGDDGRFIDSREWTADTILQAEAEAGSAATRRAWTAERVRQAIAAWWATITVTWSSVSGKPTTFPPIIGSGAADAVAGNDARLTDARTPTAHKSSHATGGTDALSPSDIGAIPTSDKSTGGNGAADDGKLAAYNADGNLRTGYALLFNSDTTESQLIIPVGENHSWALNESGGIVVNTYAEKTTPVDTDAIYAKDSVESGSSVSNLSFANLWTWIKSKIESVALTLTNLIVTNYTESVVAIGTVTTSNTLALTNGTRQRVRLTASTECTFTMPTATDGKSFVLEVEQAAITGLGTATFTGVDWGAAGAPDVTPTAGKMDIMTFIANGTKWFGSCNPGFTY